MLRRPLVACSRPLSKWYTTFSCAQAPDAASDSARTASRFAASFTACSFSRSWMTWLTLRQPLRVGKSRDGEAPGDLGERARRRLPLCHGRGGRAAGRHRLGEEPPRRNGGSDRRRRRRRGGCAPRMGTPRAALGARDRYRDLENRRNLRTFRNAADGLARRSDLLAPARLEITLAGFLARLRRRRLGRRASAGLHAVVEGLIAALGLARAGKRLEGVIAQRDGDQQDDEALHPALRRPASPVRSPSRIASERSIEKSRVLRSKA